MPELVPAAPGSPEWLAARRTGVTATDIVTILGLSRWDSPYSLYWRKLGQVPEVEDNDRFRLGRELEPYVEQRWCEAQTPPVARFKPSALYRSSVRPWQLATPDGTSDRSVFEGKTWADAARDMWQDGPPPAVRAQVLWQMDVMDVATGHVGVVFLPSGEFRSYVIEHSEPREHAWPRDHECPECADIMLMREAGEEFMARLNLELPAPDPDASAASLAAVRARFARQPDKTAEIDGRDYGAWLKSCAQLKLAEDARRANEIQLREQAGEASVLTVDGQPVARRVVFDSPVKAHTRHMDYLKRVTPEGDATAKAIVHHQYQTGERKPER